MNEALTAVVVLCQRQKVDSLPAKYSFVLKFLIRIESFSFSFIKRESMHFLHGYSLIALILCVVVVLKCSDFRALLKLAKKATELSVGQHLCTLATKVRMGPFFEKFWNGLLIQALKSEAAESDQCLRLLLETVDDPRLSSENAGLFFR